MKIDAVADLKVVSAQLHDARFGLDEIEFDATARVFTLKCWIPEQKPKAVAKKRLWRSYILSFSEVADCKIVTKENVAYYELATIRFSKGNQKMELVTHYGMEIIMRVKTVAGSLAETCEVRDLWDER
jgi:hypothetical protein